jgi:hypothetical protein
MNQESRIRNMNQESRIRNMNQESRIRRAHDVLEGCILSLAISEQTRGTLQDELRVLYESAIYPLVLKPGPDSAQNAEEKQRLADEPADASTVSSESRSGSCSDT